MRFESKENGSSIEFVDDESSRTIRLKERTIKRLLKAGMMHESFDKLVNRVLDGFERAGR